MCERLSDGPQYWGRFPYLGKIPILTNIFQMGWFNHQLVCICTINESKTLYCTNIYESPDVVAVPFEPPELSVATPCLSARCLHELKGTP